MSHQCSLKHINSVGERAWIQLWDTYRIRYTLIVEKEVNNKINPYIKSLNDASLMGVGAV